MDNNKLAKWIENKYGVEAFSEWISVWLESEEWNFPAMLNEIPEGLLNPFKDKGIYYRGMTIGDDIHLPMNSEACSWTPNLESAEYFSGRDNYAEIIKNDGEKAYGVIYKVEGLAINLNKVSNYIVKYIEDNNLQFEGFEYIKGVYESYESEEEFITGFNIKNVCEILRTEC